MASNLDTMTDDNVIGKNPFMIIIDDTFDDIAQVLEYATSDERLSGRDNEKYSTPKVPPDIAALLAESGESALFNKQFQRRKCRDSSLGGNDTINCYPQFCEDDDIIHPLTALDPATCKLGMGRVYNEIYDDQQQILYLSFGIPEFAAATEFYTDSISSALAKLMNTGETSTANDIGRLLGTAVGTILALPILPIRWLVDSLEGMNRQKVTKYYDFSPRMFMYYKFVNSMIVHLSVCMGLGSASIPYDKSTGEQTATSNVTIKPLNENDTSTDGLVAPAGLPLIFKEYGFDIYRILCKKYLYQHDKVSVVTKSSEDYLRETTAENFSAMDGFRSSYDNSTMDADAYIGFRIEKSTDASESI